MPTTRQQPRWLLSVPKRRNNGPMIDQRVRVWLGDLAIMLVIVMAAAVPVPGPPGPAGPFEGPPNAVILPVTTMLAAVLIPLRRLWPVAVFATAFGIYVFTVLVSNPVLGTGIAVAVAAFSMAYRTSRAVSFLVGGIGAAVIAVLSFLMSELSYLDPQIFQISAAVAIATALGDSARSRQEYSQAMAERAERAEQTREAEAHRRVAEERLRIAQDLHDTVAHCISVISLNAGVASSVLTTNPDKAKESLGTIRSAAREVLGEIGVLLRYLRADEQTGKQPGDAPIQIPQPGISDLKALVTTFEDSGLHVDFTANGNINDIDEMTGRVTYRVIQEGLTNAHKHGSGMRAGVEVDVGKQVVRVTLTNPTSDSDRNQPDAPRGGLGLTGLRERVASIGGRIRTEQGTNFRLIAELPCRKELP